MKKAQELKKFIALAHRGYMLEMGPDQTRPDLSILLTRSK